MFNAQFCSVFTQDNGDIPNIVISNEITDMPLPLITYDRALEALLQVPLKTYNGPDNICAYFVRKIAYSIVLPISIIF